MKTPLQRACFFTFLMLLAAAPFIALFTGATDLPKTHWMGYNPVIASGTNFDYHPIANIELGLRSDGVVVWRKLEDK